MINSPVTLKVFVYFNLHKKCFSIKALEGPNKGRVIGHANDVLLSDVTFKVSEAGRQRVLREQRKNVHAGVCGTLVTQDEFIGLWSSRSGDYQGDYDDQRVTYNPYKYDSFVLAESEVPIKKAAGAVLEISNNKAVILARL
jgi:hypothetical protein